jgi:hypothetical protein
MQKFYCVTTSYDDLGRVVSHITNVVEADCPPMDSFSSKRSYDVYNDWYSSLDAANAAVMDARNS